MAREGDFFFVVFQKILADFGAEVFQQKADVAADGVVAQNGMALLGDVVDTQRSEGEREEKQPPDLQQQADSG